MRAAFLRWMPDRRRAASFALALAVEALILFALLLWGPRITPLPKRERLPSTFSLIPAAEDRAATKPERHSTAKASAASSAAPPPKPPIVVPLPRPTPPVPDNALPGVIPLSLADNDISKVHGKDQGDDAGDSKLAYGPGLGPGGMPLYRAEWYREPSNAELNGYVKAMPQGGGWALIACRTIENYHVDNCRSIGEAPLGSGLGRDMRLAAWQFLVRPPRRGGKPLIGSWVSIRIDFHVTVAKRPAGPRMPFADGPKDETDDAANGD